ncbi:shikimate kinase [Sphingomonas adhaesiva]|uniref:shikimate kinase n=1 Tax=Sphingomonas adhaesiva TaxID=28212 RepID=UPI002FF75BB9
MRLLFIYGPPASGKLTIGRMVADRTGFALFHNHLIVDAVAAVFPFGSDNFVQLRERFWLDTISAAAHAGRSIIFTFAPEPTVAPDFPSRLYQVVEHAGGEVLSIALNVEDADQEKRLIAADRAKFGKLQSLDLLRELRPAITACMSTMPPATLRIDTGQTTPGEAAEAITQLIGSSASAR